MSRKNLSQSKTKKMMQIRMQRRNKEMKRISKKMLDKIFKLLPLKEIYKRNKLSKKELISLRISILEHLMMKSLDKLKKSNNRKTKRGVN